jgi:hypothetical protein
MFSARLVRLQQATYPRRQAMIFKDATDYNRVVPVTVHLIVSFSPPNKQPEGRESFHTRTLL